MWTVVRPIDDFRGDGEDLQANKGGDWCCCIVVHQSLLFHVSGFIFPILCESQDWRNLLIPWKVIPWTKSFRYFDGNMANLHLTLMLTLSLYLLININPPTRLKPFDFIVPTGFVLAQSNHQNKCKYSFVPTINQHIVRRMNIVVRGDTSYVQTCFWLPKRKEKEAPPIYPIGGYSFKFLK